MAKYDYLERDAGNMLAKLNALPEVGNVQFVEEDEEDFSPKNEKQNKPAYEKRNQQGQRNEKKKAAFEKQQDTKVKAENVMRSSDGFKLWSTESVNGTKILKIRYTNGPVSKLFPLVYRDNVCPNTTLITDDFVKILGLLYDYITLADYPIDTLVDIDQPAAIRGSRLYRLALSDETYLLRYKEPVGSFGKLNGSIKKMLNDIHYALSDLGIAGDYIAQTIHETIKNIYFITSKTLALPKYEDASLLNDVMATLSVSWKDLELGREIPYKAISKYSDTITTLKRTLNDLIYGYEEAVEDDIEIPRGSSGEDGRYGYDSDDFTESATTDGYDDGEYDEYGESNDGCDEDDGASESIIDEFIRDAVTEDSAEDGTGDGDADDGSELSGDNGDDPYARHLRKRFDKMHQKATPKNDASRGKEEKTQKEKATEKLQAPNRVSHDYTNGNTIVIENSGQNNQYIDHAKEVTIDHTDKGNSLKIDRIVL